MNGAPPTDRRVFLALPSKGALGAWGAACALVAGALLLLGLVRFQLDAYVELRTTPEPEEWHEWPVLPNLGGYSLAHDTGYCVGHGALCSWNNVLLSEPGPWLRRGVSLDGWYLEQNIYSGLPAVRGSGTMRVVSARDHGTGPENAIAAFEEGKTSGAIAFRHDGTRTIIAAIVAALAALVFGGLYARRRIVATRAFLDPTRFVPGLRDASGSIQFEGETPPLVPDATNRVQGKPGPVLVRIVSIEEGTYRSAPATRARAVVDGTAESLREATRARVVRVLRRVFFVALALGAFALLRGCIMDAPPWID